MRKLGEREQTLGAVIFKVNEIVDKLNTLPITQKIELPKTEITADIVDKKISNKLAEVYNEIDKLKQNVSKALQQIVDSVNENFSRIDNILSKPTNDK